jgi:hypothetical protein
MPGKRGSRSKAIAEPPADPEVMFTLTMHEKMQGAWRRRAGTWVSTTAWTMELTQEEYEMLNRSIAALRKARRVASHA